MSLGPESAGIVRLGPAARDALIKGAFRAAGHGPLEAPAEQPPCVRVEILSDRAREIDPLLLPAASYPFWGIAGPTVITLDGVDLVRLHPEPPGTVPNENLCVEMFEAIVDSFGVDDEGSVSGDFVQEGVAAMRAVLRNMPPRVGLPLFRGEAEARRRQSEAVARAWSVDPEIIAFEVGRPFVKRKLAQPDGSLARLAAAERDRAEAAARDAEAKAREEREEQTRMNDKTLGELHLQAILVPHDDFVGAPPVIAGSCTAFALESPAATLYVWPTFSRLPIPEAEVSGWRVCDASYVPRVRAKDLERRFVPSQAVYNFWCRLRRRILPDLDRGPITRWTREGLAAAAGDVERVAPLLLAPPPPMSWWLPRYVADVTVRGYRIRPDVATALILDAMKAAHEKALDGQSSPTIPRNLRRGGRKVVPGADMNPTERVTDPEATQPEMPATAIGRDEIGALCAAAAAGGEIGVGELLTLPSRETSTSKKKGQATK